MRSFSNLIVAGGSSGPLRCCLDCLSAGPQVPVKGGDFVAVYLPLTGACGSAILSTYFIWGLDTYLQVCLAYPEVGILWVIPTPLLYQLEPTAEHIHFLPA